MVETGEHGRLVLDQVQQGYSEVRVRGERLVLIDRFQKSVLAEWFQESVPGMHVGQFFS